MGVPVLLRDVDVHTEYPADVDDENITDKGYLPTLPGELTKFSSSLAMFNASRVLARVMEELYPSSASYKVPLSNVRSLSEELESWSRSLPNHLRLQFAKDKPGVGVISSRSPLIVSSRTGKANGLANGPSVVDVLLRSVSDPSPGDMSRFWEQCVGIATV